MKYGVAFAGGGIKSLSQLPVINYLQDKGIELSAVSGTSAGSLVATLVALGLDAKEIEVEIREALEEIEKERVLRISGKDLLFNKEVKHGLIDGSRIEKILTPIMERYGVHHISDVKIPLAITSVDLVTGNLIVFVSHPKLYNNFQERTIIISDVSLAHAMRASMSFPLVFSSTPHDNFVLVDGGLRMNCPVPMLRDYGVDKKLAITMRPVEADANDIKGAIDVMGTVYEILSQEAEKLQTDGADYLLNIPLGRLNIFDTKIADVIIDKGTKQLELHEKSLDIFFSEKKSWLNRIISGS